jgi:hypothetical protein
MVAACLKARLAPNDLWAYTGCRFMNSSHPADQQRPHPEEHRAAMRLEGWAAVVLPTLRDASLRLAPQGEVVVEI